MNTDKTSLENKNQPSCLGAVSGSFPYSIYEEELNKITQLQLIRYSQNIANSQDHLSLYSISKVSLTNQFTKTFFLFN